MFSFFENNVLAQFYKPSIADGRIIVQNDFDKIYVYCVNDKKKWNWLKVNGKWLEVQGKENFDDDRGNCGFKIADYYNTMETLVKLCKQELGNDYKYPRPAFTRFSSWYEFCSF